MDEIKETIPENTVYQGDNTPAGDPASVMNLNAYNVPDIPARCQLCGTELQPGRRFCICCGNAVDTMQTPAVPMQAASAAPMQSAVTAPFVSCNPAMPMGNYLPAAPKRKKAWPYILIGVSAFALSVILILFACSVLTSRNVKIMDEEKMIFGTWEITEVLDPYTGSPKGTGQIEGKLVLNSNLSGKMDVNGQTTEFTWFYLYIDDEGDYDYFLRDDSYGADMYYVEEYNELWVFSQEYWLVYSPA